MKVAKKLHYIKRYMKIWIALVIFIYCILQRQYIISVLNNLTFHEDFDLEYFDVDDIDITETIELSHLPNMARIKRKTILDYKPGHRPCRHYPRNLKGNLTSNIKINVTQTLPWDVIESSISRVYEGKFSPRNCKSRYNVAIIIPLRNRESQLKVLLAHMHPIWQRQNLDYTVYTITQAGEGLFNRAKLINVGVSEATKEQSYDCFVFHDVDLLLEDDRCLYWCDEENPRHISMYMDKFAYEPLSYSTTCRPASFFLENIIYYGGVSSMTPKQFNNVNGFSNFYWGWGGEDDDMYFRLKTAGYDVSNPYGQHCSFRMIAHEHESSNAENEARYTLLYHAASRMRKEGLNTLRYKLLSVKRFPLYVNITVDIGRPSMKMLKFMSRKMSWTEICIARVPWRM
uniref:beta-1,4-galactosyltransferase 4-like n=1 Tax=Styela clava TaxID=7725 RepID=UPI00193A989A|nr:beta-1,4-galactosyltransferase 4-like [Styela clava]